MLFAAAGLVTAEVLLRKGLGFVFGSSFVFSGSDEISAYLFAVGTSWSMAHVLVNRGHVRIDALYGRLSARVRALLDLFALLALGLFVAALLERAGTSPSPVTSKRYVRIRRCACRSPGHSFHGSPASRCSSLR